MAKAKGRIRSRRVGDGSTQEHQAVCLDCNHRTQWFKNEDTAQNHLDDHLDKHNRGASSRSQEQPSRAQTQREGSGGSPSSEDATPPGGQNTGPRG